MGKLNGFFATNTALAKGSFWRRWWRTPLSLSRFASCPLCGAGSGVRSCPRSGSRSRGGTRRPGFVPLSRLRKRQRGERARIQQGLLKHCQLCQTMPKNPTGKDSAHAQRGDAPREAAPPGRPPKGDAWEKPAPSCGSALAQGTLHMPRAGDVRGGILQGLSQSGEGRRSRRTGLRGLEL